MEGGREGGRRSEDVTTVCVGEAGRAQQSPGDDAGC